MNRFAILAAALMAIPTMATAQEKTDKPAEPVFTVVKANPVTSVKNQHRSGTCWAYSSLAFIESELLRMGKGEFDLEESFLVYNTYMDRADRAIRTHGDVSFSQGGSFYDVIYCMKNYGLVPQGTMKGSLYGDSLYNFNQLDAVTSAYVGAIAKTTNKTINPAWRKDLSNIYANYFGELPTSFTYKGKTYTPQSFVSYLGLNPDDYISLTSYTHHPFYSKFILEIQDNWRWAESYNLPLNEFMEVMETAVRNGYTFAWGADVSEEGFNWRKGIVTVPAATTAKDNSGSDAARWTGSNDLNNVKAADAKGEKTITQEMRQLAYDNWETTDDHGMLIYGLAKDQDGKEYFMMKNSWGDSGPFHGHAYISKPYVAYKTMNIVINKKALPKSIAKKLGLN